MFCRKLGALTTTLVLAGLTVLALACGPASPSERGAAAQVETPAPTEAPTPTIQPTATPYPPGYVKPTDLPTWTPFPTLPPNPTLEHRLELAAKGDSGADAPKSTPTPTLAEQVTQYARENADYYDAIARVRSLSHRSVTVPEDIEWPPLYDPTFIGLLSDRTGIQTVELYHGELPDNYELASWSFRSNLKLDIGQEYILFILKVFVAEGEYTDDGINVRYIFNEEQLEAAGGKGGAYYADQAWIVDGEEVWRVPGDHLVSSTSESDLAMAKADGDSLPLSELKAAIAAAFK